MIFLLHPLFKQVWMKLCQAYYYHILSFYTMIWKILISHFKFAKISPVKSANILIQSTELKSQGSMKIENAIFLSP